MQASIALRSRPRTKIDIFSADEAFRPRSTHFNSRTRNHADCGYLRLDQSNNFGASAMIRLNARMLVACLALWMSACGGGGSSTSGTISVPDVVGQTQSAATTAITGAALAVGTVTTESSNTVASGTVISQSPAGGTAVASGSAVNLIVSSGPAGATVPNVVGKTQAAATSAMNGGGLVLGTATTESSNTVPSGTVISQSPAGGTAVASGSAVNLIVSSGPATAVVETVVYSFGASNTDGQGPQAGLIRGADGNFYGTCSTGGVWDEGTVFKVTPAGGGSH